MKLTDIAASIPISCEVCLNDVIVTLFCKDDVKPNNINSTNDVTKYESLKRSETKLENNFASLPISVDVCNNDVIVPYCSGCNDVRSSDVNEDSIKNSESFDDVSEMKTKTNEDFVDSDESCSFWVHVSESVNWDWVLSLLATFYTTFVHCTNICTKMFQFIKDSTVV